MDPIIRMRKRLELAQERVEHEVHLVPGDTRRALDSAVRQIRSVLEQAGAMFLEHKGYGRQQASIRKIMGVIRRDFTVDRQLGRQVAHTLGRTSTTMHSLDDLSAPPLELVRYWLDITHRFLDALESELSKSDGEITDDTVG